MIRKLALAISLVGALGASAAQALGLGEATVDSNLNQPLNAEIELVSAAGLSPNDIITNFASREEFARLGVDRSLFLSDVRFKVDKNAQGKLIIRLSSSKPVKEPYLNFLVEVVWPSGRLLREYALLIDPPLFAQSAPEPISAPAVQQSAPAMPVKKSAPVTSSTSSVSAPSTAKPAVAYGADTYGPTSATDTLWDIAQKVRPDASLSTQQTMLAIQDLNGGAFIDDNINKLKRGQVLRLPNRDQINSRSREQAVREVVAQNKALAQKSPEARTIDATAQKPDAKQTAPAGGDQLKIVVNQTAGVDGGSHGGEGGTSGGTVTQLQNKLTVTEESLDATKRENQELTGRVRDLESQIDNLQRLITLKNDELAGMQNQAEKTPEASVPTSVAAVVEPVATVPEAPVAATPEAVAPDVKPETEVPVATDGASPFAPPAIPTDTPTEPVAEAVVETEVAEVVVETPPAPVVAPTPADDLPFMDRIFTDPMYQLGAGGGLIALIGLLWAISRRNAKKESEYFSKVASESASDSAEGSAVAFVDEDSAEADADNTQRGAAGDALAEAEVYIAYGRLDQAAHVLEAAVSKEPSRTDLRLKLLEVYADDQNASAFERQFDELRAFDDDTAIAHAESLRGRFDSVPSIDDLESQLLATPAKPSLAELEAEETREREARQVKEESTELDAIEFDLGSDVLTADKLDDELSELDMDTDFADLDLDGDDSKQGNAPRSSLDADLDLEEFNLDVDDNSDTLLTAVEALEDEVKGAERSLSESPDELDALAADLEGTADTLGGDLDESFLNDLDAELEKVGADGDASLEMPELELSEELTDDFMASGETAKPAATVEVDVADDLDLDLGEALAESDLDVEAMNVDEMDAALAAVDHDLEDLDLSLDAVEATESADDAETDAFAALSDEDLSVAEMELAAEPVDESESEDFDFLAGADEAATKLDLARAYIDMGDTDGARDILEEVSVEGNDQQKTEAQKLLDSIR